VPITGLRNDCSPPPEVCVHFDAVLPATLARTISETQGQTLRHVGLGLRSPVFVVRIIGSGRKVEEQTLRQIGPNLRSPVFRVLGLWVLGSGFCQQSSRSDSATCRSRSTVTSISGWVPDSGFWVLVLGSGSVISGSRGPCVCVSRRLCP